jgi:NAD(P) transhydrogenase
VSDRYDMVVLGAGPTGEKAAAQAAYWGKRVAVVERSPDPGGAMVASAVSTKTIREAALYLTGFRRREVYGVGISLTPEIALDRLHERTRQVVRTMREAADQNLHRHGIDVVHGSASITPSRDVEVTDDGGATRRLETDVVLIATGSRPLHPPGIPFDDPDVLDSESARELDRPLRSLVVVGGGAVGCECASVFTALGAEVTLVDSGPRLLSFMDGEVADLLADTFRALGMRVVLGAGRAAVARDDGGVRVELANGDVLQPEKVVFAAGRIGNTEELGLAEAGVATDERGRIVVDDHYRTTADRIYAAGDVIGPPALASVSMEQGRVAACHAFGIALKQSVDSLAPFGVYSIPEVAMAGLTEEAAQAAGIPYAVGRAWFEANTRAAISGSTDGLVKLVFDPEDRRLLGVHVLGESASELVHLGQAVISFRGPIDWFIHSTFNVPTATEAYKYAAYNGLANIGK